MGIRQEWKFHGLPGKVFCWTLIVNGKHSMYNKQIKTSFQWASAYHMALFRRQPRNNCRCKNIFCFVLADLIWSLQLMWVCFQSLSSPFLQDITQNLSNFKICWPSFPSFSSFPNFLLLCYPNSNVLCTLKGTFNRPIPHCVLLWLWQSRSQWVIWLWLLKTIWNLFPKLRIFFR